MRSESRWAKTRSEMPWTSLRKSVNRRAPRAARRRSERFPGLAERLAARVALFGVLRDDFGLHLRHSWRSPAAAVADERDARLLAVPPGSPVMVRDGINVDHEATPTVYLSQRIRGDRIRFTMTYDLS